MLRFVAYLRVSTDKQGRSGLGLEAQRQAVERHAAATAGSIVREFVEVESGRKKERPQLTAALHVCRTQKVVLLVAKLDRLARNVAFVSTLMESGVEFVAADQPTVNRLTVHILAAVAEEEARAISARTKAALQAAKTRGVRLGSPDPREVAPKGGEAMKARADRFAANVLPIIREVQAAGITTVRGIAHVLNARGISTARGGTWGPSSVALMLSRAAG